MLSRCVYSLVVAVTLTASLSIGGHHATDERPANRRKQDAIVFPDEKITTSPVVKIDQLIDISPPTVNFRCGLKPSFTMDRCQTAPPPVFHEEPAIPSGRPSAALRQGVKGTAGLSNSQNKFGNPLPDDGSSPIGNDQTFRQFPRDPQGTILVAAGVGGFTPLINAYPWTALMGFRQTDQSIRWGCDGAVINERWIVTAAHCFNFGPPVVIRLGEHDYNSDNDTEHHRDFGVARYIPHPLFVPGVGYHDLALLELAQDVQLTDKIAPVCLPWGNEAVKSIVNERVVLAGWGATEFGGELSSILQEVHMTVFNASTCDASYSTLLGYDLQFPEGINEDNLLCVGHEGGGRDACKGDSGGPLTYCNRGVGYTLAGVVSKGHGCGLAEFPGLYAPLHRPDYLSWIKQLAF